MLRTVNVDRLFINLLPFDYKCQLLQTSSLAMICCFYENKCKSCGYNLLRDVKYSKHCYIIRHIFHNYMKHYESLAMR